MPAGTPPDVPAGSELAEVLDEALHQGVIDELDVDLLVRLAVAADEAGVTRTGCGQGGLCSRRVAHTVAAQQGVSTIRRRASSCLHAVAAAYAQIPA